MPASLRLVLALSAVLFWMPPEDPVQKRLPPFAPECPAQLDSYGGIRGTHEAATGYFHTAKVGSRWLFITPQGSVMWMLGVFDVDAPDSRDDGGDSYAARIARKYPDKFTWGSQAARRLKSWGFNTLGEYSTWYVLPSKSPYMDWSNPEKLPFVAIIKPSYYSLRDAQSPVKDLVSATDPEILSGWRGSTIPDVFDPAFDSAVAKAVGGLTPGVLTSPWLVGIASDDSDELYGFGPGPDIPAVRLHPHLGWVVLAGNFQQAANEKLSLRYSDPRVFSKFALRDLLRTRYGSIQALNAAWGSSYTTWDSDGGWPYGKGWLDESGRNRWIGRDANLGAAAPAVVADLDEFLGQFASRYFSVCRARIHEMSPHALVFGPATLNGWGGLTRKPILQAAGKYLDVLQVALTSQRALDLTAQYAGDLPMVTWEGMSANADSALWRYTDSSEGAPALLTQFDRGQTYAARAAFLAQARTPSGTQPVAGLKFWAYTDSWSEKRNWGLVTLRDNPYDGTQAVPAPGTDRWGFSTGGEERNYGDFLSGVTQANLRAQQVVWDELRGRSCTSRGKD